MQLNPMFHHDNTLCSYYSTTIFCEVGVPAFSAAVAVGMVVLVASFLLTFIIDKVQKRVPLAQSVEYE